MTSSDKMFSVKQRIGVLTGISFIVGNIIGSGIFISPKGVYAGTGSVGFCLIIWTVCGFIAIAGAFVYADLGLMIQRSGGDYVYISRATGKFLAFMFIWVQILVVYPMSHVIKSLTVGEYLTALVIDGECGPREIIKRLIAAVVIGTWMIFLLSTILFLKSVIHPQELTLNKANFTNTETPFLDLSIKTVNGEIHTITLTMLNVASVHAVAKSQIFLMVIKIGALIFIVLGGFIHAVMQGSVGNLGEGFEGTTTEISGVAAAMYSGIWAYNGWMNLNYSMEEVYKPRRTLPLAISISVVMVLILYVLVNVSYFAVLSRDEFLSSWAVGVTWEEKVIGANSFLITLVVALSVFGSGQGAAFSSARLSYAAARGDTFPEILSYIHVRSRIPTASVLLVSALAMVYLALPGSVGDIINVSGFIGAAFQSLVFISHIILSYKMRKIERPIKVPVIFSGLMALVFAYLFVAPLIGGKFQDYIFAIAFLGAGVIIYFPFVHFKLRLPLTDVVVGFIQLVLDIAPPDKYMDQENENSEPKGQDNMGFNGKVFEKDEAIQS